LQPITDTLRGNANARIRCNTATSSLLKLARNLGLVSGMRMTFAVAAALLLAASGARQSLRAAVTL
jgi:hypothetical protein